MSEAAYRAIFCFSSGFKSLFCSTVYSWVLTSASAATDYIKEQNATYVTNAVVHARQLLSRGMKVLMIGGELKASTAASAHSFTPFFDKIPGSVHHYYILTPFISLRRSVRQENHPVKGCKGHRTDMLKLGTVANFSKQYIYFRNTLAFR